MVGLFSESNDNCGTSGLDSTALVGGNAAGVKGGPVFGTCKDRPYSFGGSYAGGPFRIGIGYNNPGNVNDNWVSTNAQWDFGVAKLWGFYGKGKNTLNQTVKSGMLAVTVPLGQGEFRAALIRMDNNNVRQITGTGLGYFYSLSKRTTLYTDFARNSAKAAISNTALGTQPNGYDFGIKHVF